MANINITSDAWTEISISSGTVQNISATADIELSAEQTDNSGVVLKPSELYQWDNETIYARAVTEETGALRVVNFKKAAGGGGGYVLPVASASTLGGVKIGDNVTVDANGVLSAHVTYSTTEQVIGTWINGKPLYQITLEDTMPTVTVDGTEASKTIDISLLSIDFMVDIQGIEVRSNLVKTTVTLNCVNTSSPIQFRFICCYKQDTSKEYFDTLLLKETQLSNSENPCYITLRYTKSTD